MGGRQARAELWRIVVVCLWGRCGELRLEHFHLAHIFFGLAGDDALPGFPAAMTLRAGGCTGFDALKAVTLARRGLPAGPALLLQYAQAVLMQQL